MAFGKLNFIVAAIGMLFIITGFVLMSGDGSTFETFNPDIFSPLRIKVAPAVCVIGFIAIGVSIMLPSKKQKADEETK